MRRGGQDGEDHQSAATEHSGAKGLNPLADSSAGRKSSPKKKSRQPPRRDLNPLLCDVGGNPPKRLKPRIHDPEWMVLDGKLQ